MVEGTSGGDQWGRGRDKGHRSKVMRCQFGSSECVDWSSVYQLS